MYVATVVTFASFLAAIPAVPIILCYNNSMSFRDAIHLTSPPIATVGPCYCRITSQVDVNRVRVVLEVPSANQTSCTYGQTLKFRPSIGFGSTLSECRQGQVTQFGVSPTNSLRFEYSNPLRSSNGIRLTVSVTEGTSGVTIQCDGDPLPRDPSTRTAPTTTATTHEVSLHGTMSKSFSTAFTDPTPIFSKSTVFRPTMSTSASIPVSLPSTASSTLLPSKASGVTTMPIQASVASSQMKSSTSVSTPANLPHTATSILQTSKASDETFTPVQASVALSQMTSQSSTTSTPASSLSIVTIASSKAIDITSAPIQVSVAFIRMTSSTASTPESLPSIAATKPSSKASDVTSTPIQSSVSLSRMTPSSTASILVSLPSTATPTLLSSKKSDVMSPPSIASSWMISPSEEASTISKKADTSTSVSSDKTTTAVTPPSYPTSSSVQSSSSYGSIDRIFTDMVSSDKSPGLSAMSTSTLEQESTISSWTSPIIAKLVSSVSASEPGQTIDSLFTTLATAEIVHSHLSISATSTEDSTTRTKNEITSKFTNSDSRETKTAVTATSSFTDKHDSSSSILGGTISQTEVVSGHAIDPKTDTKSPPKIDDTEKPSTPIYGHKTTASPFSNNLGLTIGMIWTGLLLAGIIILGILYCKYRSSVNVKRGVSRKTEEALIE